METRIEVITDGNGVSKYYPQYLHKGWFKDTWKTFKSADTYVWKYYTTLSLAESFINAQYKTTTHIKYP